jgi:hypothetical protein
MTSLSDDDDSPAERVLVDCPYSSSAQCAELTNDPSAPLTWDVNSGNTPSQGTGPNNGVNDAYYIFVETSNKNQNDRAK